MIKYLLIWLCVFNGASNVKITMTLPSTQESMCGIIDIDPVTLQPVPMTDLGWVLHTAYKCNGDSIKFPDIDVRGMEGDSLGIDYEFLPGTMGRIVYRTKDTSGNISCRKVEYTFAVPLNFEIVSDTLDTGITGSYYRGVNRNIWIATRRDTIINFNWGANSPLPGIPVDSFSVQWIGELNIPVTGQYTIFTDTREGIDLYIDGNKKIEAYGPSYGTERSTTLSLTKGLHGIRLDHVNYTGDAYCILRWSGPNIPKQVIPRSILR